MTSKLQFSIGAETSFRSPARRLAATLGLLVAVSACGDDASDGSVGPGTHEQVATILGVGGNATSCSISSCHGTDTAEAGLELTQGVNLHELLVGVPSCEAPSLNLVEAGDPDKSWLYLKVTGKAATKSCTPTGGNQCLTDTMPQGGTVTLTQAEQDALRKWIQDGATAPQ